MKAFLRTPGGPWRPGVLLLIAALTLVLSGCVQNLTALRADVNDLKHEAFQAKKERAALKSAFESPQGGKGEAVPPGESIAALRNSQTELYSQVSDTLRQMQTLNGRFDENKYFVDKELKRISADLEVMKTKLDDITASRNLAQSGELKGRLESIEADIALLKAKLGAAEAMPDKDARRVKPSPNDMYDDAYRTFEAQKYDEAVRKMQALIRDYPDNPLAGNARFWIGESFYNQKKFENAILAYEEVITRHKDHQKVPAAMLKQGYAFLEIGDKKAATVILRELADKYPATDMAARAKEKLATIR